MGEICDNTYDITLERKRLLMCEPHMMAFTAIMKHEKASEQHEKMGIIACTNGDVVYYGTKFASMRPEERCYVAVHELMHGIFMHPDRAQLLRLTRGTINPALFNYAGDAIINEGIEANPSMASGMFAPPKEFPPVRMAFIHKAMAEAISFTGATPPSTYDPDMKTGMQVEVLYDWLMWALDAVNKKRREDEESCPRAQQNKEASKQQKSEESSKDKSEEGKPGEGDDSKTDAGEDSDEQGAGSEEGEGSEGDGSEDGTGDGAESDQCDPSGSPSDKPCTCGKCDNEGQGQGAGGSAPGSSAFGEGDDGLTQIERMAGDTAWDIEEQLDKLRELLESGATPTELIDKINSRMEDARIRIEQVVQGLKLQGRGQGSLLMELMADMPKPVVPWNRVLRKVTTRGLGTKLNDSYVRYGSNTMTALARGSRVVPFSPGTTIFTERPRILVILDVSGSHIGMLPVCFSEIWSIAQMKGAVVEVMTFDHGVQEILEIKNRQDFLAIMRKGIRGGGGTVLDNVWERVKKMRDPYRMAVIMTDGYLDEGKKPSIPVVWLVTPGGASNFTYGEIITLPEVISTRKAA